MAGNLKNRRVATPSIVRENDNDTCKKIVVICEQVTVVEKNLLVLNDLIFNELRILGGPFKTVCGNPKLYKIRRSLLRNHVIDFNKKKNCLHTLKKRVLSPGIESGCFEEKNSHYFYIDTDCVDLQQ